MSVPFVVFQVLADALTGERMHVLDPRLGGWAARMRGWATEEGDGRWLPACFSVGDF